MKWDWFGNILMIESYKYWDCYGTVLGIYWDCYGNKKKSFTVDKKLGMSVGMRLRARIRIIF